MIEVQGADQLARLAKNLKEAGDKELQKELAQAINRALKPVKADIKQSAGILPSGISPAVAASQISTRRSKDGIRLVARSKKLSLYHLNRGQIRHRKGGNINAGKVQPTTPGFFTKPAEAAAPRVQREIVAAMDEVARKIVRGV